MEPDPPRQPQPLGQPGRSGARLLPGGLDAFTVRAVSARAAAHSIDLQYYIWHSDATGRYLAYELLQAADRGVCVRLLIDDMDAHSRDAVLVALDRHPQIEIRLFNPFAARSGALRRLIEVFSRGARLNHRMHNKSWIADRRLAIVGGRNIGDEYFAASADVNFIDMDVLLAGAAVDQAARSFEAYWNNVASVPVARLRRLGRNKYTLNALRSTLQDAIRESSHSAYARCLRDDPQLETLLRGEHRLDWRGQVEVVSDDPRKAKPRAREPLIKRQPAEPAASRSVAFQETATLPRSGKSIKQSFSRPLAPGVLESMIDALGSARSQALLISPYFVPGTGGAAALRELVRRGVDVAVLTNSLAATDVAAVHSGYARYRKVLLEGGVKLYELKPAAAPGERDRRMHLGASRASLHTKAAIIDRRRIFVGSFNLDPRSAELNCEMGAWIDSASLSEEMLQIFRQAVAPENSFALSLDERGRMRWTESAGGQVVRHDRDPHASLARRAITWLLRWVPIESQL